MNKILPASVLALSVLLSACGGGSDEGAVVNEKEPTGSGLSATVTVASTTQPVLAGSYSSTNLALNNVTKVNPIGGEPETCRFKFSGLQQAGSTRLMDGDLRYVPGTTELRSTFVSIDTIEYSLQGTTGGTVDKPNNRVVFTNAVLTSTQGTGGSITLNGAIPMRGDRPEGC